MRVPDEFIFRLPGKGCRSLAAILKNNFLTYSRPVVRRLHQTVSDLSDA